jgi:hypothetical protein
VRPLITEHSQGRLRIAGREYEWIDVVIDTVGGSAEWAHPGMAVGSDDSVYVPDARGTVIRRRQPDGHYSAVGVEVTDTHGLAITACDDMWIADHGHKFVAIGDGSYDGVLRDGAVIRSSSQGEILDRLEAPAGRPWRPSGVALHKYGLGSSGRIWVADGYGRGLVHCFSEAGALLWTSDGAESGTAFSTPHSLIVDDRAAVPVLRVADRGNRRIVTLSLDGHYRESTDPAILTSPSGFAVDTDLLWVTELNGGVVVLDPAMTVVDRVGSPLGSDQLSAGWPNAIERGTTVRPSLRPMALHSPHGIAATSRGEVWITEWCIGGRVTRLAPP